MRGCAPTSGRGASGRQWRLRSAHSSGSSGESSVPSSRQDSRSSACYESSARRPTRAAPDRTGTSTSADLRFEDAARLLDRVAALEDIAGTLAELERLRALELCLLVPAAEDGFRRAFFVSGGRVAAARTLLPGPLGRVELEAGMAAVARAEASLDPVDTDELLLVGSFLRRPPPELRVIQLAEVRAAA